MAEIPEVTEINLAPGQFYFGGGLTRVRTLLGSCVAITMYHPVLNIGGMCHYLLASRGTSKRLTMGFYADEAVSMFVGEVSKQNTKPQDYEVKLFGGGEMFDTHKEQESKINIAEDNIAAGCRLLKQYGFKVKARDLGGDCYRKIILELWNGDVWVQRGASMKRESGT